MDKMLGSVSGLLGMHRKCVKQRMMHVAHAPTREQSFLLDAVFVPFR